MIDLDTSSTEKLRKLSEFRFLLRKFLSFSETVADAAGISAQQYQLMQVIASSPDGRGAAISLLADRMFLRHNSAVELVDRAVRAGLVKRQTDEDDLRRSLVSMTPEGRAVLDRLIEQHLSELDKDGPEIIGALQRVLQREPEELTS